MSPPRRKRPEPTRTQPHRGRGAARSSRSGLSLDATIDEGLEAARRLARATETTVEEGIDAARRVARDSEATVKDVVERGVDTAYLVIEEYMLRGRRAAGRHHERRKNGSGDMDDTKGTQQDWTAGFGPMPPLMAPMLATMKLWTDAVQQFVPGGSAAGRAWMEQMMALGAPWWGAGAALAPHLAFEVTSTVPAEVSATLDPMAYFGPLSVGDVVSAGDATAPPITGVGITSASGHVIVRVAVPATQPQGRYTAAIQDESGARRGELVVEVKPSAGIPAASA